MVGRDRVRIAGRERNRAVGRDDTAGFRIMNAFVDRFRFFFPFRVAGLPGYLYDAANTPRIDGGVLKRLLKRIDKSEVIV